MADTGAPWSIPYQEPADLVRDYPAASEDLADAIAAGLTAAGKVKQIAVGTDGTNRTTSSTTLTDATISVSITPTDATSKILLLWMQTFSTVRTGTATTVFGQLAITDSADVVLVNGRFQYQSLASGLPGIEFPNVVAARVDATDTAARTYKGRFSTLGTGNVTVTLSNANQTGLLLAVEYAEA